jgi:hypothetical protein
MYRTDMPTRRPLAPRRHPLALPRGRLRAAQRLAGGLRPAALARVERVAEAEVDALLARPDFQRLVAALEALEAMPEEDRLRRLEGIAFFVLEHALAEGDWRCAAFVLTERRLGRNPALTLARRAVARQRRAAKPPPEAPAKSAAEHRPAAESAYCPASAVVARAEARLRDAVVDEHAARHAAEAAAEVPTGPAPAPHSFPMATSLCPTAPRQRRLDAVAARLRSGAASWVAEPQPAPAKGLLRAWAQGP